MYYVLQRKRKRGRGTECDWAVQELVSAGRLGKRVTWRDLNEGTESRNQVWEACE